MFGYGARLTDERRGCTGCSLVADHFDGVVPHLNGRDITLVSASIAPLQELQDYKRQMGWRFPWVSSLRSDFNYDFGAFTEEQRKTAPTTTSGMSTSRAAEGGYERLRASGRRCPPHLLNLRPWRVEALMGTYQFLDLAPWGRNEDGLEFPQAWWRRHDEYDKR